MRPGRGTSRRGTRTSTSTRGSRPLELLLQAREATRADDDVVEQFDLEEVPRLDQLLRDLDIGLRGSRVTARVEMCMFVLCMFIVA